MNPLILKFLTLALQQLPTVAQEIEKTVADAETPEAGKDKVKALITDAVKILETVAEAL